MINNDQNDELLNKVIKMVLDDGIEILDDMLKDFNVFDVLGAARAELRHSNTLAYLLDPVNNHGLEDGFVKQLIKYAIHSTSVKMDSQDKITLLREDYSNITVSREWRRVDIMVEGGHFILAIENKVDSYEHGTQLSDYEEVINKRCGNSQKVPIYMLLSPDGREAEKDENKDKWIPISYSNLCDLIEKCARNKQVQGPQAMFINNYIQLLRREFGMSNGTDDVKEIAMKFYKQHREAINYIMENIVNNSVSVCTELIQRWLEEFINKNKDKGLRLRDKTNKMYVRFRTEQMDDFLKNNGIEPNRNEKKGGWGDDSLYYYEIVVYPDNKTEDIIVKMQLSFSSIGCNEKEKEVLSAIIKKVWDKNLKANWQWKVVDSLKDRKDRYIIKELKDLPQDVYKDDKKGEFEEAMEKRINAILNSSSKRCKEFSNLIEPCTENKVCNE